MVLDGFGWFRIVSGGFGWFRVVSDGFGWLAVLVVKRKNDVVLDKKFLKSFKNTLNLFDKVQIDVCYQK